MSQKWLDFLIAQSEWWGASERLSHVSAFYIDNDFEGTAIDFFQEEADRAFRAYDRALWRI